MKAHDTAHEEGQDAAIRALAAAVHGLAASLGKTDLKGLPAHIAEILGDEPPAVEVVVVDPPKAEMHVTPPEAPPSPEEALAAMPTVPEGTYDDAPLLDLTKSPA